jgi:adenylate cyclase
LSSEHVERRLAAILAADVAGSCRLIGVDEEGTLAQLKALRKTLFDPKITKHHGRIVKNTGDGALVEFASVVDAVRCADEIQRSMAEQNTDVPQDKRIELRIGIHVGDVIIEENDIFGDGVNIAVRLEGIAEPGGVSISDDAHRQIRGKIGIDYDDMGPQVLKNIAEPMRVWCVRIGPSFSPAMLTKTPTETALPLALPDKPSIAVLPFQNMSGKRIIETPPGRGFRLIGPVREEQDSAHAADANPSSGSGRPTAPLPEGPSIAVLPFKNLSEDRELAFFADGVAEDVLTELSHLRWLRVTARNSSFVYKDRPIDVSQAGCGLAVRYVLEGSVRRAERRIRATCRLTDATTGTLLWGQRFERNVTDAFNIQDEIAKVAALAIATTIVHAEQRRAVWKLPADLDAWEAYQRGMWHMSKCDAAENRSARAFFQRSIELDPSYPAAYGALAWSNMMSASIFSEMTIAEGCALSEPLVRKAIALDQDDTEVRVRLALTALLKGDLEDAVAEAEQVLSVDESCAGALGVKGAALVYSGNREEGRRALRQYLRLSPRDPARPIRLSQIATSLYLDGNYQQAAITARQVVRQYPSHPIAYRWLAASLGQLGRTEEARDALQALQTISPSSFEMYVRHQPKYCSVEYAPMLDGLRKAGWRE